MTVSTWSSGLSLEDRLFSETAFPGKYIHAITTVGILPTDSEEERINKALLSLMAFLGFFSGIFLGIHDIIAAYPTKGVIPFSYSGITLLGFIHFKKTKQFHFFRFVQLFLILLAPFMAQILNGGFMFSGSSIAWAIASPLCAAMFYGPGISMRWFLAFLAILGMAAILDPYSVALNRSLVAVQSSSPWFFFSHLFGISLVIFSLIQYFVFRLKLEQEKSERLLLNVLPQEIAQRLKSNPAVIADAFPEASILFADLAGFTNLASSMIPVQILEMLNLTFSRFDLLTEKYRLEKIKTIGDCYMVVGGIPAFREDHAQAIADMALEMRSVIKTLNEEKGYNLSLRIGINSGPVVAGVIGMKKFIYDLWGDAVNVASRMESSGIPGEIQVTERTYELLKNEFEFTKRGAVSIKGKGEIITFLLTGRRNSQKQ